MLLGLLPASVVAADWSGCAVLPADLVDDDDAGSVNDSFTGVVVDDWAADVAPVGAVVVDGDFLAGAPPAVWLSGCEGTGLLRVWSDGLLVVESFLGDTVPDNGLALEEVGVFSVLLRVTFRLDAAVGPTSEGPMGSAAAGGFGMCLKGSKQIKGYTQPEWPPAETGRCLAIFQRSYGKKLGQKWFQNVLGTI